MKNILLQIIACLFLSYTLSAVDLVPSVQDTVKDKREIEFDLDDDDDYSDNDDKDRSFTIRTGVLDLGISTYVDGNNNIDLPEEYAPFDQVLWRSINVGWQLANVRFDFSKEESRSKVALTTGIKLNWNHYSMEQDYNLVRNQSSVFGAIDRDVPELRKNRLRATYLQIPVMLEFDTNPRKSSKGVRLGVGYVQQFLLGSQYKYKTTEGDKFKSRGGYNLRKSMGLIEARVGVGHINFYMQYGLDHLFTTSDGNPELTPLNFGINIIPR